MREPLCLRYFTLDTFLEYPLSHPERPSKPRSRKLPPPHRCSCSLRSTPSRSFRGLRTCDCQYFPEIARSDHASPPLCTRSHPVTEHIWHGSSSRAAGSQQSACTWLMKPRADSWLCALTRGQDVGKGIAAILTATTVYCMFTGLVPALTVVDSRRDLGGSISSACEHFPPNCADSPALGHLQAWSPCRFPASRVRR